MTDLPTTYESHTTTTTSSSGTIGPRMDYIKTIPGILKIVEMVLEPYLAQLLHSPHLIREGDLQVEKGRQIRVLDLLVFICACVLFGGGGGAWVRFVSMSAFISTLIYFLLHFLNIIARFGQINYLIVLDVIVFICSVIPWWPAEGWVGFVSMSALLTTLILFLLYLFGIMTRVPPWRVLIIISFVLIICSSVRKWKSGSEAQAFTQFVCIVTFIMALTSLLLHILVIIARFPGPWLLIEFIYYCVFSVFYLIAAIVAASYAKYHSSIAACTFFAFAATAIYAVDTYFQFRAWRTGQAEMTTTQTSTTTTVQSSSHVETKTTY
ncbi:hypothetical protein LSH36_881g02022 [Paralvinella palmiformis]|uniref:MARVEL domain-containing protein n=1 Tax=Paralvinella palmiformis TaxID=53620 RepID=A0AAD9MTB2_9ANNE|nr:hypothetical protein LSH36_881g02022 [Paralvinella palmiformis]